MLPGNLANIIAVQEEERLEDLRNFNLERRLMRTESDPFTLNDNEFKNLFRLTKDMAHYVLNRILPNMHHTDNAVAVTPHLRFFAALYFFASGAYQRTVGQSYNFAMSQQTVSRAVVEICGAIVNVLGGDHVRFPVTPAEKANLKARFMQATGFPGTIGAIDCTHVAIIAPQEEEHNYFNRKGFHSKNVQIICSYDLHILNINAQYAGATHDAYIWRRSALHRELQTCYNNGDHNTWLVGDSGYPQQPWLMTPIPNAPAGTPEFRYTETQMRTRNCVERCIGVLKGRFRCLLGERKLRYSPEKVGQIINACCILHNICVNGQLDVDFELPQPENFNIDDGVHVLANEGMIARQNVVNRYFQ